jgi:aspartate aminotransferase
MNRNFVAKRVETMNESETLAMARKSRELKAQGKDIISLSLGEPDFDTPDFIKEAGIRAIQENHSHYTPVQGYADLLEAIAFKLNRDQGLLYTPKQIVCSNGAKQSIANLCLAVLNPGDEVLVPAPYWVSYREIIRLAGGIPVELQAGHAQNFKVSAAQLEQAITPKTKMLMFSSPCNPTGAMLTHTELGEWVQVLAKHPSVLVVSDEIYELIAFDQPHVSIAGFPGMYERTVIVNGMSKGFAMTGWRLGYLAGPVDVIDACLKIQGQLTSAPSSIAQKAAIAGLLADPSSIQFMVDAFKRRRDTMAAAVKSIPGFMLSVPPGAFYLFPDISECLSWSWGGKPINDAQDFCSLMLEEAGVAMVPGDAFGAPGCIRLSYAADGPILEEAVRRIRRVIEHYHALG